MAIIETLARHSAPLTKIFDAIYEDAGDPKSRQFAKVLKKGDTSGPDYRTYTMAGFGQHMLKGEIGPIRYDSLTPGREWTTVWKEYALGWRISGKLMRDAQKARRIGGSDGRLASFFNFTKRARTSAEWTMEYISAYAIRNADIATADDFWPGAGSDGKALAATDHPILKGGTASNINGAASLTSTALQDSITLLRRTPNDTGQRGGFLSRRLGLIVGPVNEWKARTILTTMQVQGSANNDEDPLNEYKRGIVLIILDELNDWDGWALVDLDDMPLEYFLGREPTYDNQIDWETSAHLHKSEFEFAVGYHGWRRFIYNSGTN
jgi:hypothetical protein